MRTFRLVIACPDGVGIVAKVSNFLASHNGWITEASHHSDDQSGWFFMRHEIRADSCRSAWKRFVRHLPRSPKSFRWNGALPIRRRKSAWY